MQDRLIDFEADAPGWAEMADDGARKLDARQAASTSTPRDLFLIENTTLYLEICRRIATDPDLANHSALDALADQFTVETGAMAKRYGIEL